MTGGRPIYSRYLIDAVYCVCIILGHNISKQIPHPWNIVQQFNFYPKFKGYSSFYTVQPRLSGPRLSGTSIIRTSLRPKNTLPRMRRRRDQWSFVGVVIDWAMSYGLYRLALAKIDWPKYFSEHCWPWSYCIGIVYRLGIINQARNVGISVIRTFHLSGMAAIGWWTKGSG